MNTRFEKLSTAVAEGHRRRNAEEGKVFSAPARVNLIGEHTDYTGGFVLPLAIDFATVVVVSLREDNKAVFYSENYTEEAVYDLSALPAEPRKHWSDYCVGVVEALGRRNIVLPGFTMTIAGDIPFGAGLSSSASFTVAVCTALLSLTDAKLSGEEIARVCQEAENVFVHSMCGIMDQFVIVNGVAEKILLLDTRSLESYLLPLSGNLRVIIANSMMRHSVAEGAYGDRRAEVEAGQAVLSKANPMVKSLRDANLDDLKEARSKMTPQSFKRCRHIITENARVLEVRSALFSGDLQKLGDLLFAGHISMRDDFEASAPEVDKLVEIARSLPGCVGARITGGGFGGCTVNLVETDDAESFAEQLRQRYKEETGIEAEVYITEAVDGALARIKA